MKTSHIIRTAAIALSLLFSGNAIAGGVTVAKEGESKLKMEALFFLNTTANKTETQAGTQTKSTGLAVDRAYLTLKYSF